ncbi:uncharacterized protein LOC111616635 [Centruroides sculpturatus]|uniref:uncharacterized protein LOC111616635 n=1 Tax=Centruroides sculpturatus TaxID=218467 RepID=UPI000C6EAE1F|nr:uncharacterized protein LOC111616635 [Centruroides sculpturatus]XP_023213790.1 uncharacterized protein LOC111616635 [Centruroides sculpturatus]XP_023213791.1 uncharacterized protein LOC111616635 [Centruroides sculpturatus]
MENSMARNSSFWSSSSAHIECQDFQNTTISNKLSLSYKWSELNYPKSGTINSSLHSVTIEHLNTDSLFSSSENCNCFRRKELNLKILRKRRMKNANIFAMNANPFIKSGANETIKNINNRKIKEISERRNGLEEATNDSISSIFGGRRRRLAKRLFCTGAWAASTIVALWVLAIKFLDENYPWDLSMDLWLPELWEKAWSKVVWRRPGKPPI